MRLNLSVQEKSLMEVLSDPAGRAIVTPDALVHSPDSSRDT